MNRKLQVALVAATAWAATGPAEAQATRVYTPRASTFEFDDPNAPRIGVFLGENGIRDTLGVLVNSVVNDGPAAKAGIKEGDRIQSIGAVSLKMTRDDAGDDGLSGMMSRRLVRELDKLRAGDEIELRVFSSGAARTVRVKTVAAREIENTSALTTTARPMQGEYRNDRAALGLSLGGPVTKRDTLGVFVVSVSADGPAEKAGIVEGDRIAMINGTDLRVPSPDAGDNQLSRARSRRLNQEIAKLAPGDAVTLTVVSGGRQREVKVNAVKASELNDGDGFNFFFGGDGTFSFPQLENLRRLEGLKLPNMEFRAFPRGGVHFFDGGKISAEVQEHIDRAMKEAGRSIDRADVREHVERAMQDARKSLEKARTAPRGSTFYRGDVNIDEHVREQIDRAMERAHDALEKAHKSVDKKPIVKRSVVKTS